MKTAVSYGYVFTPGAATLDLSAIPGFTIRRLYAVLNQKTGGIVYSAADPARGYSALAGAVLTLQAAMAGMTAADDLLVIYDDPASDPALAALLARTPAPGQSAKSNSSPVVLASDSDPVRAISAGADGRAANRRRPVPVAQAKPNILFRPFRDEDGAASFFGTNGSTGTSCYVGAIEDFTSNSYDYTTGHRTCLSATVYNWALTGFVLGSNGANYDFDFHGRVLAFRMIVPGNTPLVKFGIRIDGRAYRYDFTPHIVPQALTVDLQDFVRTFIVATDLPPGRHHCTFVFPGQQSVTNSWVVTDLGVEDDGAVNKPFPATSQAPRIAPALISATAFPGIKINPRSRNIGSQAFALRRVILQNTNAFAASVAYRPYMSAGQAVTTPMSIAVPPGSATFPGTVSFDAPAGSVWAHTVELAASVATGVYVYYETAKG